LLKQALVTGASGFIGSHLCRCLQQQGWSVRGLSRSGGAPDGVEAIACDLASQAVPQEAVHGVDVIFHLAGKAHALAETKQDENMYFRINTEATELLLQACCKQGVKTFVYFSSVKAVGDIDGVMDESVVEDADTPYGQSKRAAEKLVLEGKFVPKPVVIRPSMVYGNTDKGNLSKMIRAVQAGRFPPLPEMGNKRSMVHVDDVVRAAILAAEQSQAAGQTYVVTDGQAYSTRQMYEWICEALQKTIPGWYVPLGVLKALAKVGDAIGKVQGKRFMFDSDALQKLSGSAIYSSKKIQHDLGFKAQQHLKTALPEIIRYLERVSK